MPIGYSIIEIFAFKISAAKDAEIACLENRLLQLKSEISHQVPDYLGRSLKIKYCLSQYYSPWPGL